VNDGGTALDDPNEMLVTRAAGPDGDARGFFAGVYADLFEVVAAPCPARGGVQARGVGPFLLTRSESPGLRLVRPVDLIARGGFDGFALRLTLTGRVTGRVGETAVAGGAGDLLLLDFLEPLDLVETPEAEVASHIALWLPRAKILAAVPREQMLGGLILGGATPFGAALGGLIRALAEQAMQAPGSALAAELSALGEGVVGLLAKAAAALPGPAPHGASNASFVTIRRHIDRNLRSPALTVEGIAANFGISRAALYRLFEPVGGVARYIRQNRLRLAHREITAAGDDGKRIGLIAYGFGFKNVSAFNRAFRDAFGVSPGEARAQRRAEPPTKTAPPGAGSGALGLAVWLARLGRPGPA